MKAVLLLLGLIAGAMAQAPLVPVSFYVMSKCPDFRYCTQAFSSAFAGLESIVDLKVDVIANEQSPGQFSCMHGPTECQGNIQQLCAQDIVKKNSSRDTKFILFDACQENSASSIPSNGQQCARQTGIDWDKLNSCYGGQAGKDLFSASIKRTKASGQTVCCTVTIANAKWCQHNGSWVSCRDGTTAAAITKAICDKYSGSPKPPACNREFTAEELGEIVP